MVHSHAAPCPTMVDDQGFAPAQLSAIVGGHRLEPVWRHCARTTVFWVGDALNRCWYLLATLAFKYDVYENTVLWSYWVDRLGREALSEG